MQPSDASKPGIPNMQDYEQTRRQFHLEVPEDYNDGTEKQVTFAGRKALSGRLQ